MSNIEAKLPNRRPTTRWLMVIYDTVVYSLCWAFVLMLSPQMQIEAVRNAAFIYAALGYALFQGSRFAHDVYKMILRYGSVSVFARLLFADAIAAVLLVSIALLAQLAVPGVAAPFMTLIGLSASYALVCLAMRVLYCYAFRFAQGGRSKLAKAVRFVLERCGLVSFDSSVSGGTLRLVLETREKRPTSINELQWVVDKFAIRGEVTDITQINKGYINRTYRVKTVTEGGHVHTYTLQRINTNVFRDVDALMDNYKLVTDTLYGKLRLAGSADHPASVQTLRSTKDGRSYLQDASGCWRMMTYFEHVYSLDIPNRPETFYQAGYAFGQFLKEMADMNVEAIQEVIPNFHNTKSRYLDLEKSIALDPRNRVKDVQPEIDFVRARKDQFGVISDALEKGEIPRRICHNDCNLNNILFDEKTDLPVAIIDMDTVMPSSPLYDYGDSMRIGTNTAKDDEKDLSLVSCDLHLYEQYAKGYLKACGLLLTKRELELLPYASLIITAEDGIRFLMDHIDGDTYYNISYPGQNLDRARTQLKLVEDMERKLPQIKQILRRIYADMALMVEI